MRAIQQLMRNVQLITKDKSLIRLNLVGMKNPKLVMSEGLSSHEVNQFLRTGKVLEGATIGSKSAAERCPSVKLENLLTLRNNPQAILFTGKSFTSSESQQLPVLKLHAEPYQ